MKKTAAFLLLPLILLSLFGCSEKIEGELTWYGLEEGIKKAQKEDKMVFVDNYADWCGWCRKMDENVFSDEDIAKALNEKFVSVKLDVESRDMVVFKGKNYLPKQLSQSFGVQGLPTFIVLNSKGDVLGDLVGYVPKTRFLKELEKFTEK